MNKTFDFKLGAEVRCRDKSCGRLSKLVITPINRQLTHLIVETGFLFKQATVIPFEKVENCVAGEIDLSLHADELQTFPKYEETLVSKTTDWSPPAHLALEIPVAPTWESAAPDPSFVSGKVRTGVDPESLLLGADTAITGLDGHIGYLNRVIVGEGDHFITHVVVCRGTLMMDYRVIPAHWLETVSESSIHIKATPAEVDTLPEYVGRSDKLELIEPPGEVDDSITMRKF